MGVRDGAVPNVMSFSMPHEIAFLTSEYPFEFFSFHLRLHLVQRCKDIKLSISIARLLNFFIFIIVNVFVCKYIKLI